MLCFVRLSRKKLQPYWMEEIPIVPIQPMIPTGSKTWQQSGKLSRAGEEVDYIIRLDTYLLYIRYRGDKRFSSSWHSIILHRTTHFKKTIWRGCCPFCSSSLNEFCIYERTIRCKRCLPLRSRWRKQGQISYKYRQKIRMGDLSEVAKALKGTPNDVYRAMLAMEMTGLAPIRFTIPKEQQPWTIKKNRGKRG